MLLIVITLLVPEYPLTPNQSMFVRAIQHGKRRVHFSSFVFVMLLFDLKPISNSCNIITCISDCRRGFNWWIDLLTSFYFRRGMAWLGPLGTSANHWPTVRTPDDTWIWGSRWNENWQGKSKYSEETSLSATSSTTNPIWPDLGSNHGRLYGKPVTNRLSYGTAFPSRSFGIHLRGALWSSYWWRR
jgi:hypothetical protein